MVWVSNEAYETNKTRLKLDLLSHLHVFPIVIRCETKFFSSLAAVVPFSVLNKIDSQAASLVLLDSTG